MRNGPPKSRSRTRWRLVLLLATALLAAGGARVALENAGLSVCTVEAKVGPDGQEYGRDPAQGCRFVDEEGRVLPGQ